MLFLLGISHNDCFFKVFMAVVLGEDLRKGKTSFSYRPYNFCLAVQLDHAKRIIPN